MATATNALNSSILIGFLLQELDEMPVKKDGFKYDIASYLKHHHAGKGWHRRDAVDYLRVILDNNVVAQIDNGTVDEVWLFGGPYFGYWESAMAGLGLATPRPLLRNSRQ
jgi:hypothetical protein